MITSPPNAVSADLAKQILLKAEQNGLEVETYLQKIAAQTESENKAGRVRSSVIKPDSAKTRAWLQTHRREYVVQWIVLDGNTLIGAGANPIPIVEQARAAGIEIPFVQFIADDSEPFMGGWL